MKTLALLTVLMTVACTSQKPADAVAATPAPTAVAPKAIAPVMQNMPTPTYQHKKTCAKGEDKRELEVVKNGEGCKLNYTQKRKTKDAATAAVGLKQCEHSEEKIVAKLEKSGFKCN